MNNHRHRCMLCALTTLTSLAIFAPFAAADAEHSLRPNILMFLVDDMGWQDTSEPFLYDADGNPVITPLNQRYRTPSMERLADRGMKFTNAYAMPVCTPTRVSLMTGLNSARHHVTNWTAPQGGETSDRTTPTHRSPTHWNRGGLPENLPTLPALLRAAGYRTIHCGKAHFGNTPYARDPLNVGFDINIAGSSIGHPGSYTPNYGQGHSHAVPNLEAYHNTDTFLTEALTRELNQAITASVEADTPFFAHMSHYAVHAPFHLDPRFADDYPDLPNRKRNYATLIAGMDKSLGDILDHLEQLGVAENTLVVFMSDNGGDAPGDPNQANTPLRHKKGSEYEGGSRVPMIAAWAQPNPEHHLQRQHSVVPNSVQHDIVAIHDLHPTFLALANVPCEHPVDGHNLLPYFAQEPNGPHRPQQLLLHLPHGHNGDFYTTFREGPWKLIHHYAPNTFELYHLTKDISEAHNLAATQPDRTRDLAHKMARTLQALNAQPPTLADGSEDPIALSALTEARQANP